MSASAWSTEFATIGEAIAAAGLGNTVLALVGSAVIGGVIGWGISKGYEWWVGESMGASLADVTLPSGETLGRWYYCQFVNRGSCGSSCP